VAMDLVFMSCMTQSRSLERLY